MSESSHLCGGACCRAFSLPLSPANLAVRALLDPEAAVVLGMVEYLGLLDSRPYEPAFQIPHDDAPVHYYSCTNILDDGRCGIYEDRPGICRRFPYSVDKICNYNDCEALCAARKRAWRSDVWVCG